MTDAVIYARISQDRTGAGLGVERQVQDCRALAESLGWRVVELFTDNDISAYSGKMRPAYHRMLDLLATGRVRGVIAWHTDRLHRSPLELEEYIDVAERHGVTTHTAKAGEVDLSTPSGRAVARTLGAWARYESEHKSERISRAMRQLAEQGKFTGGRVPYGYHLVDGRPEVEDHEAAEIRRAVHDVLAGRSLASIIREMTARGVKTRPGNDFSYATLRQLLLRPKNAGLATYQGEVTGISEFPAIISESEFEAVRRLLTDPGRRRSRTNLIRHLVAGLALCGVCGAPMRSATATSRNGARRTVYRCKSGGVGHPVRNATPINDLVSETMIGILSRPDAASVLADRPGVDVDVLRAESMALRERLDGAAVEYADGNITNTQLATITDRVRVRQQEVSEALAAAQSSPALAEMLSAGDVRTRWETSDLETRRAVIDALATVYVDPQGRRHGRTFDPASVRILPRQQQSHEPVEA